MTLTELIGQLAKTTAEIDAEIDKLKSRIALLRQLRRIVEHGEGGDGKDDS